MLDTQRNESPDICLGFTLNLVSAQQAIACVVYIVQELAKG